MVIDVNYTEFLCILFESRHITCLYVYNIRKLNNYASRNSNASKDSPQLEIVFYTNENCIIGHLQLDFYGVEFSPTNLDSMGVFSISRLMAFQLIRNTCTLYVYYMV